MRVRSLFFPAQFSPVPVPVQFTVKIKTEKKTPFNQVSNTEGRCDSPSRLYATSSELQANGHIGHSDHTAGSRSGVRCSLRCSVAFSRMLSTQRHSVEGKKRLAARNPYVTSGLRAFEC